jgi:RNA polymerase sigma-70 factor (ECF subfamily)
VSKGSSKAIDLREFKKIYDLYWDRMYAIAYHYVHDHLVAEEMVQDVFVYFWEKRVDFTDIKDLSAFLFRCTKNRIYDHFDKSAVQEKLKRNISLESRLETYCTEESIMFEDTLKLLNDEISKLPTTTQTVFRLSRFHRFSNREIASQTNLSIKAVEYHITVALRHLHLRVDHLVYVILVVCALVSK